MPCMTDNVPLLTGTRKHIALPHTGTVAYCLLPDAKHPGKRE